MPTVLDTHAWLWWMDGDGRLSKKALAVLVKAQREATLWVPMMAIWELAKKIEKGQLVLDRPFDEWLDVATSKPGVRLAEITAPVLVESCRLPQPFHGDPADQIIVATARQMGATLVTRDARIREYRHVRTAW